MIHEPIQRRHWTPLTLLLLAVVLAGGAAITYRLFTGLGATTGLNDDYPWGIWKAVNVLIVIALGAGGFTSAALIYIFGGERYHAFARSAVLLAILGYGSAGFSLAVDIGIPWRIVFPIWLWPEHSPLFEVAWCVMLYLTVLALELAPAVLEKFHWTRLARPWRALTPLYSTLALTFFVYAMSHSVAWSATAFAVFGLLAFFLPRAVSRPSSTPVLLIMFGIILSTCHQSTLGTLFLLMQEKLSHLWWTPMLPVNFLLSAISVGFCMVILERTFSAVAFGRKIERDKLAQLGKMAGLALWAYILVRVIDLGIRGQLSGMMQDPKVTYFLSEMALAIIPALMLLSARVRNSTAGLSLAALLTVGHIVLNRLSVCIFAMTIPGAQPYVPTAIEVLITASVFAGILLIYGLASKVFPIFAAEPEPNTA